MYIVDWILKEDISNPAHWRKTVIRAIGETFMIGDCLNNLLMLCHPNLSNEV